ncbi:MAG: ribosome maturation factor RimM [Lachnospiraceae bacterium]|nr:ribosome maturation factor RimM [Lachnospiraceae bacterium]
MNKDEMLRVGVFSSTHGVHGEIKVFPTTDDPSRFEELETVYLDTPKELKKLTIAGVKFFKGMVILKFKEFDDINLIEPYKGCDLLITRDQAVPLAENEVFIFDILGAKVVDESGNELGELSEILTTGANDVYVVKRKGKKELLLPSIPSCILDVNTDEKVVTVHVLPGLED